MTAGSDKIMITRKGSHWVFCDNRDGTRGTIIDLAAKIDGLYLGRDRVDFGAVLRELRKWTGEPTRTQAMAGKSPEVPPAQPLDRAAIKNQFLSAGEPSTSPYLNSRGINAKTLQDSRFRGNWRVDSRGNVLFPHHDSSSITGFEIKNRGFTSFSPGGQKSAWHSKTLPTDNKLLMTESAIDALSYHQLNPDPQTRYISTAGALSDYQRNVVRDAIQAMPPSAAIVLAFDNDPGGERLAREIHELVVDVDLKRAVPAVGKDWNEFLLRRAMRAISGNRDISR